MHFINDVKAPWGRLRGGAEIVLARRIEYRHYTIWTIEYEPCGTCVPVVCVCVSVSVPVVVS